MAETLPSTLACFLQQQQASYRLAPSSTKGPRRPASGEAGDAAQSVRVAALEDTGGAVVLALYPAEYILDLAGLCKLLQRTLQPLSANRFREVFPDCEPDCHPPLGRAYGVTTVVDINLYKHLELAFDLVCHGAVLNLPTLEFQRLMQTVELGHFSYAADGSMSRVRAASQADDERPDVSHLFPMRANRAARQCEGLPPLPETAGRLLQLASDPHAGVEQLASLIECDAPAAVKILRHANSSFYGQSGKITDLKTAIARILGFDVAMGIAIGMSIGKTLCLPEEGPLGLQAYRRDSVFCAALAKTLAHLVPRHLGAEPGKAYMAGLLHDIGILFLGQSFPEQYRTLSMAVAVNPHIPVTTIENTLLKTGHETLGGNLLSSWGLPQEVVTAARYHHNATYRGDHHVYAHLVGLSVRLLNEYGLAECGMDDDAIPATSLERLELREAQAREAVDRLLEQRDALEYLAHMAD